MEETDACVFAEACPREESACQAAMKCGGLNFLCRPHLIADQDIKGVVLHVVWYVKLACSSAITTSLSTRNSPQGIPFPIHSRSTALGGAAAASRRAATRASRICGTILNRFLKSGSSSSLPRLGSQPGDLGTPVVGDLQALFQILREIGGDATDALPTTVAAMIAAVDHCLGSRLNNDPTVPYFLEGLHQVWSDERQPFADVIRRDSPPQGPSAPFHDGRGLEPVRGPQEGHDAEAR